MLQVMEEFLAPSIFAHVEFVLSRATPHPSNVMSVQSGLITFAASPYVAFYFFQAFYKQIIRYLKIKYWDVKIGSYECLITEGLLVGFCSVLHWFLMESWNDGTWMQ